eukprot:6200789-Pleurochrysis_carterae.AAC.3
MDLQRHSGHTAAWLQNTVPALLAQSVGMSEHVVPVAVAMLPGLRFAPAPASRRRACTASSRSRCAALPSCQRRAHGGPTWSPDAALAAASVTYCIRTGSVRG